VQHWILTFAPSWCSLSSVAHCRNHASAIFLSVGGRTEMLGNNLRSACMHMYMYRAMCPRCPSSASRRPSPRRRGPRRSTSRLTSPSAQLQFVPSMSSDLPSLCRCLAQAPGRRRWTLASRMHSEKIKASTSSSTSAIAESSAGRVDRREGRPAWRQVTRPPNLSQSCVGACIQPSEVDTVVRSRLDFRSEHFQHTAQQS
jgi:hypothetical protein